MAKSFGPRVGGKTSGSTFYQIAGIGNERNSSSSSLGQLNYPLFFLGTIGIAIIVFFIRQHNLEGSTSPGVVLQATPASDTANVANLTNEINMMNTGAYNPYGSANPNPI
jgi:hypothetical protein